MAELAVGGGIVGIGPCPGRGGDFAADLAALLAWRPDLVLSMATMPEMARVGAGGLPVALAGAGVAWLHCPVADYGVPSAAWDDVAAGVRAVLGAGGRVHVHCMAGCGRSGAAVVRLMVMAGEEGAAALARLRAVRPCAVETAAQAEWAVGGTAMAQAAPFRASGP